MCTTHVVVYAAPVVYMPQETLCHSKGQHWSWNALCGLGLIRMCPIVITCVRVHCLVLTLLPLMLPHILISSGSQLQCQYPNSRAGCGLVGKILIVVLMYILIERKELIIFHTDSLDPKCMSGNTYHCNEYQEYQSISPSAQVISKQLKELVEDRKKTDNSGREIQKLVDDEEVINPDNSSILLTIVFNSINNNIKPQLLHDAVRHHSIHPSW